MKIETVLVIEYGHLDTDPKILLPAKGVDNQAILFNYTSIPQKELLNATTTVYAAAVVGGGSTANHMMFDRGSREDYDNWGRLGNVGWDWEGLLPYFKKVILCFGVRTRGEEVSEEMGIEFEVYAA
jgi:choline dehydrogenase-like flavoprotein